jgi:hypothetical protein
MRKPEYFIASDEEFSPVKYEILTTVEVGFVFRIVAPRQVEQSRLHRVLHRLILRNFIENPPPPPQPY